MNAGRHGRRSGDVPGAAHALRSSLNGIHTWAHVLEARLRGHADPQVRRALDGIHEAIAGYVRVVEDLAEGRAVEAPGGIEAARNAHEAHDRPARRGER